MHMLSRALLRAHPLIVAGLLATAASFAARGVSAHIASRLVPDAQDLQTWAAPRGVPERDTSSKSADAILRHNVFSSTTPTPTTGATETPTALPSCAALEVHAIVASEDPEWAFAALKLGDGSSILRRKGGHVGDDQVAFVGNDEVWLRQPSGQLCQARMFGGADAGVSAVVPAKAAPTDAPGIHQVDSGRFEIDRGLRDRILEAPDMLKTPLLPIRTNGRVTALRVTRVQEGSLLERIGIKTGDDLQTMNGFDLTDVEKAMAAYARLRTEPHLSLTPRARRRQGADRLRHPLTLS